MIALVIPTISDAQAMRILSRLEVQENGCIYWTGALDDSGYGRIGIEGKTYILTRVIWARTHGSTPIDKLVLHNCDYMYPAGNIEYRKCVNINHLYLGTDLDNARDRELHNRGCKVYASGADHHNAFITQEHVYLCRELKMFGYSNELIGNAIHISPSVVSRILTNKHWLTAPKDTVNG